MGQLDNNSIYGPNNTISKSFHVSYYIRVMNTESNFYYTFYNTG